jgi:hypothetical protein
MRLAATALASALASALALALAAAPCAAQEAVPLNTLKELGNALRKCWVPPSRADSSGKMDLTVMLSFRASGELFGGRITHVSRAVSDNERALYYVALEKMIQRCSHLPVSSTLGEAIAGRPFIFRITDTRREKRA